MLKQILISSLTAIIISILIVIGFYSLIPLSVINPIATDNGMFGTTITTISGSDTVQNALKVIANDNFAALNAGKIETSATTLPLITTLSGLTSASSLATVGTIGTGVWNATALTVAYGGTGSTTLSSNQVLLGNGTGILKTVAGFGTSGQFLTSNGVAAAPSWQTSSIDQTQNYTWTGLHTFNTSGFIANASSTLTATTTIAASDVNNNALVLNGQAYKWPTSQNASSSVLMTDNAGTLIWIDAGGIWGALLSDTLQSSDDTEETTTSDTYVKLKEIVLNRVYGSLRIKVDLMGNDANGAYYTIYRNGVAVGSEQFQGSSYGTKSEDITGWRAGDAVQVYVKKHTGATTAYVKDFRIYFTKSVGTDTTVN